MEKIPTRARIRSVSLSIPEKDQVDLCPVTSLLHNNKGTISVDLGLFLLSNEHGVPTNGSKEQEPSIASSMRSAHEQCLTKFFFFFTWE